LEKASQILSGNKDKLGLGMKTINIIGIQSISSATRSNFGEIIDKPNILDYLYFNFTAQI
jgi:hypothetical protein